MVRPWVRVSLSQYEKLNRLKEETGKPLSGIIREAVSDFVKKRNFLVSATASYLLKGTRKKYKSVSAYLSQTDWDLLQQISKNRGRPKTGLVGEAMDKYLEKRIGIAASFILARLARCTITS